MLWPKQMKQNQRDKGGALGKNEWASGILKGKAQDVSHNYFARVAFVYVTLGIRVCENTEAPFITFASSSSSPAKLLNNVLRPRANKRHLRFSFLHKVAPGGGYEV